MKLSIISLRDIISGKDAFFGIEASFVATKEFENNSLELSAILTTHGNYLSLIVWPLRVYAACDVVYNVLFLLTPAVDPRRRSVPRPKHLL